MSDRFPKYDAGDNIGPWSVTRHLEDGSSGEVYVVHATDDPARRPRVLKLWCGRCLVSTHEEFEEERRIAALRPGGTRMVRRTDADDPADADGLPYYTMELLDPLDEPQDFAATKALLAEIVGCVAALHADHYLHRDINERHFARAADGTIQLLDWGCVIPTATAGHDGKIVGTPDYIAPEVHTRLAYSERSDIFMLGWTLPHFCPPQYLTSFQDVFRHAQKFKPEERPTAAELQNEILTCKQRHNRLKIAALSLLVLGILGYFLMTEAYHEHKGRQIRAPRQVEISSEANAATTIAESCFIKRDFVNFHIFCQQALNAETNGYAATVAHGLLAKCYLNGLGVTASDTKAIEHALLALKGDDTNAVEVLRRLGRIDLIPRHLRPTTQRRSGRTIDASRLEHYSPRPRE